MNKNIDTGFSDFKDKLLNIDPIYFCEKYLTLDGKPFRLTGNGYKPFVDIYRYIAIKALEPDSLPIILLKSRQCGATVMAAALELYFMGCGLFGANGKPPIRVIHAFPQSEMAQKFSKEKLNPMINGSLTISQNNKGSKSYMQSLLDASTDTGDSLKFKSFKNGNFLRVDSTGISGDRMRGSTSDVIFYDEVQDISSEAIANTVEMLKQAKYGRVPGGVQLYFGTPKKNGSDFHKMWNVSTQQYFYLGCEKCKKHFPLYTPNSNDWEKIWIKEFIVKCTHCNYEQNKIQAQERGKWMPTKGINDEGVRLIGFHINQLYMPNISKEAIIAEMPGIHPTRSQRAFINESIGEFFSGDASPITSEEIIEKCGDRTRGFRARIKPNEEQMVVLGIDYGARSDLEQLANPDKNDKRGQSYTTAVVLSVKGPNLFNVDLALKFPKNDPESKKGLIDTIMRQYSVDLAIGDIGFSNDFSYTMQTIYGDNYLASRAHNKINDKIKFNADAYPKEIIFERDYYIAELIELLKKGQIKFPLKDDRIFWLIEHCTSMELKPSISRTGGDPEIHYVKGSTPNDGFMALLNAYLAYKFNVTGGFKIKNPNLMKDSLNKNKQPLAIPGMGAYSQFFNRK